MTHYAKPVSDLLTLNEFAIDDWLDYPAMGINENHREALLAMACDETLLNADNPHYWAPRHAIRALTSMADHQIATTLLDLIILRCDDSDFPDYLIPALVQMMPLAWKPLISRLESPDTDWPGRDRLTTVLTQLTRSQPDYRHQVIQIICRQLDDHQNDYRMYNGCLILSLIDLEAKEAIESIRAAFARDAVDYLCAGDLEDVEVALGLRDERATPPRDHMGKAFPFLVELREAMKDLSDDEKLEALGRMISGAKGESSEEPSEQDDDWMETSMPTVKAVKVGRNDPCPCGSGKKHKKCCLN
ncbi:MAG: hypothetical protein B0D91_12725 [Oceanospirillales bacterium LUC14_002_19_P2]|nr:MAG: hypothetical protein B0D91_12725 [Oceanospirillales bacterium LUC14_002_19_P2]